MTVPDLSLKFKSLIFIAITALNSTGSFASALYFTRDNFRELEQLPHWRASGLSDDRYIELRHLGSTYAICTTSDVSRQLIKQSSAHYMVNPEFKSGCFVNNHRFSHTVYIPHGPARESANQCFLVKDKESASFFLTLWNDKASTIASTPHHYVKHLRLEINDEYLLETGAEYSNDGNMICKREAAQMLTATSYEHMTEVLPNALRTFIYEILAHVTW